MYAPFTTCVVMAIIMAPGPSHLDDLEYFCSDHMCKAAQDIAIQQELMDPREVLFVLVKPSEFHVDMDLLRRRYNDLRNAPLVEDAINLPPRNLIDDYLGFNCKYREYLVDQMFTVPYMRPELAAAVLECEELHTIWDTMRDCKCEAYYITVRRQALKKLKELLKPENYNRWKFPPCVPLKYFTRID